MKNIFELIEDLSKYDSKEIEFALECLMLSQKIDFIRLNNAYVRSLEKIKEDNLNKLIEAETCVLGSFIYKKGNKKEEDHKHTQRCLYLLNESKRFNMHSLNEKYSYDKEFGKEMSWYEREKIK